MNVRAVATAVRDRFLEERLTTTVRDESVADIDRHVDDLQGDHRALARDVVPERLGAPAP